MQIPKKRIAITVGRGLARGDLAKMIKNPVADLIAALGILALLMAIFRQ